MKKFMFIAALSAALLASTITMAQGPGNGQGKGQGQGYHQAGDCQIPNLTEEQQKKIDALKLDHQKKMIEIKNQIEEKRARLVTVTTGDKINKEEAYKLIEEIAALKVIRDKYKLDHQLAVRALLTEEQKVWFDMHGMHKGKGHGPHHGHGMGQGMGQGQHNGNCQGGGNAGCKGAGRGMGCGQQ